MAWGSFGKGIEAALKNSMIEGTKKIWRNVAEAPLRIMEIGEDLGIVQPILTKAVDEVVYKPLRTVMDPNGLIFNDIYKKKQ